MWSHPGRLHVSWDWITLGGGLRVRCTEPVLGHSHLLHLLAFFTLTSDSAWPCESAGVNARWMLEESDWPNHLQRCSGIHCDQAEHWVFHPRTATLPPNFRVCTLVWLPVFISRGLRQTGVLSHSSSLRCAFRLPFGQLQFHWPLHTTEVSLLLSSTFQLQAVSSCLEKRRNFQTNSSTDNFDFFDERRVLERWRYLREWSFLHHYNGYGLIPAGIWTKQRCFVFSLESDVLPRMTLLLCDIWIKMFFWRTHFSIKTSMWFENDRRPYWGFNEMSIVQPYCVEMSVKR